MKLALLLATAQSRAKQTSVGFFFAVAVAFLPHDASAIPAVNLGSGASFAVLAGSGITNTGSTTITGDVGTFPTPSITGFGTVTLNGINHGGDGITQAAKTDLVAAYNDAAGRTATTTYSPVFDLGGSTLFSGVYSNPSSFGITGTLTLDGQNNPNSVFIFQAGSTLITASASKVSLINGADACNIFWQVGSSATLGTFSNFAGSILALESITLNTGANVDGRVLARNGAVTLDSNTISASCVPDTGSTLLLLSVSASLFAFGKRFGFLKASI